MKKIIFITALIAPLCLSANTCSDAEVIAMIKQSRAISAERMANNKINFTEYKAQRAYIKHVAEPRKSGEKPPSCLTNILPSLGAEAMKQAEAIIKTADGLAAILAAGAGDIYSAIRDASMEQLFEKMRQSACKLALDMKDVAVSTAKKEARKEMENELENTAFSGFVEDAKFDNWLNKRINDRFDKKYDLLEWRGGYEGEITPKGKNTESNTNKRLDNIVQGLLKGKN